MPTKDADEEPLIVQTALQLFENRKADSELPGDFLDAVDKGQSPQRRIHPVGQKVIEDINGMDAEQFAPVPRKGIPPSEARGKALVANLPRDAGTTLELGVAPARASLSCSGDWRLETSWGGAATLDCRCHFGILRECTWVLLPSFCGVALGGRPRPEPPMAPGMPPRCDGSVGCVPRP
jgi:hypothetical protein